MRYQHIIWDWNGTLLDDRKLCIESINKLLSDRSLPTVSEAKYLEIFDFPVRDYYSRAGFSFEEEKFEIPAIQFIELYNVKRRDCRLQPGVREVLSGFRKSGIGQSLLSASEERILDDMVLHYDLGKYFTNIKGLNNHYAAGKLGLGRELISEINTPAEKVLMVGDTGHDLEVARELGVDIVLFDQGHFPRHRLNHCQCPVISDLKDLIEIVLNNEN